MEFSMIENATSLEMLTAMRAAHKARGEAARSAWRWLFGH